MEAAVVLLLLVAGCVVVYRRTQTRSSTGAGKRTWSGGPVITLSMIRGLPKQGEFTHEGILYGIWADHITPADAVDPMYYSDNTAVAISCKAGDDMEVSVIGRARSRSKTNWGNYVTPYESVPLEALVIEVYLDDVKAITGIESLSQVSDERLRGVVELSRQALIAYSSHVAIERKNSALQARTAREARAREHQRQVEERLGRL